MTTTSNTTTSTQEHTMNDHQTNLIVTALGDLVAALGVTDPSAPLTGPELLHAAEVAKERAAGLLATEVQADEAALDQVHEAILDQVENLCGCEEQRGTHDYESHVDACPTAPLRAALAAAGINESCRG